MVFLKISAAVFAAAALLQLSAPLAHAQSQPTQCGSLNNAYGPLDYRSQRANLKVVEDFHFTPEVEALIRGKSAPLGGDLDYTLRASPNHHRALIALARFAERSNSDKLPDTKYTVGCYFDRAMRFAPDDTIVRMIYAGHLGRTNRVEQARQQLDTVASAVTDSPFTHYSLGSSYFDIKQYDKALHHAHKAHALGFPRTELRDALRKVGKWVEPVAVMPAASAASGPG